MVTPAITAAFEKIRSPRRRLPPVASARIWPPDRGGVGVGFQSSRSLTLRGTGASSAGGPGPERGPAGHGHSGSAGLNRVHSGLDLLPHVRRLIGAEPAFWAAACWPSALMMYSRRPLTSAAWQASSYCVQAISQEASGPGNRTGQSACGRGLNANTYWPPRRLVLLRVVDSRWRRHRRSERRRSFPTLTWRRRGHRPGSRPRSRSCRRRPDGLDQARGAGHGLAALDRPVAVRVIRPVLRRGFVEIVGEVRTSYPTRPSGAPG